MILETKYGDPPKPSCSIALVVLGLKGWDAWVIWLLGLVGRWGFEVVGGVWDILV